MGPTLLLTHADGLAHETVPTHPEHPDRLRAIWAALREPDFATCVWQNAPLASWDDIAAVHTPAYIAAVQKEIPESGLWNLDPDTVVSPRSLDAARRSVGAVLAGVDAVFAGTAGRAFCAVRPPGHHAGPDFFGGFCLFNAVAIGAVNAVRRGLATRVAIVDFDVHHGNGTQACVEPHGDILYASTHQWPYDPGTGAADDSGPLGNILNMPLREGDGRAALEACFTQTLWPRLRAFAPDLLLVSAGFDAHREDPLGGLVFETEDYGWLGRTVRVMADELCAGRLVAALEGGYHLPALAASTAAFVKGMTDG